MFSDSCFPGALLSRVVTPKTDPAWFVTESVVKRTPGTAPSAEFHRHEITVPFQLVGRHKRHVDTFTQVSCYDSCESVSQFSHMSNSCLPVEL